MIQRLLFTALMIGMPLSGKLLAKDVTVNPGGNIQTAILQVFNAGGGTVVLTEGTYPVSATIKLRSNVSLRGAGMGLTRVEASERGFTLMENPDDYKTLSNVTLSDLTLCGQQDTTAYAFVVEAYGNVRHDHINLINVEVTSLGMTHLKRVDGIEITGCKLHDNFVTPDQGGSLFFQNLYLRHCTGVTITDTDLSNNPSSSCFHTVSGDDITLTRVKMNNSAVQDGANIQEGTTNIHFIDCEFNNNGRNGIKIWSGESSGSITGCNARGCGKKNYDISGSVTMTDNNVPTDQQLDSLAWQLNTLEDGIYRIMRGKSGSFCLTAPTSGNTPTFEIKSSNANTATRQLWRVTREGEGYSIVADCNGSYLNEHAVFGTNEYSSAWNTFRAYTNTDGYTALQTCGRAVGGSSDAYYLGYSSTALTVGKTSIPAATFTQFCFVRVDTEDAVSLPTLPASPATFYTLSGQRTISHHRGITIIHDSQQGYRKAIVCK